MSSTPKFLVGETVERVRDGAVGVVKDITEFDSKWHYRVNLGRGPDDLWWGTDEAWRSHFRTHAHVYTTSQDCDGKYERSHVDVPTALERTEEFGELEFKERVMCSIVSLTSGEGTLTVNEAGLYWSEHTDEGYVHTEVLWCEQDDVDQPTTFRDHTAERAGY